MKIHLRIPYNLYRIAIDDLERPHKFASERVGLFYGRSGSISEHDSLVLISEYAPIYDNDYIDDAYVGARINSKAINKVMQHIYESNECAFHVHLHSWKGVAIFSRTDCIEQKKLVQAFSNVAPSCSHGQILFTYNSCSALVLPPNKNKLIPIDSITIVGSHYKMFKGGTHAQ